MLIVIIITVPSVVVSDRQTNEGKSRKEGGGVTWLGRL